MNNVGAREPVIFCRNGIGHRYARPVPGQTRRDDMQADFATALDQSPQGRRRRILTDDPVRSQFLFVVNQDEMVRTVPVATVEQLLLTQPRRRQAVPQQLRQLSDHRVDVVGCVGVCPHMVALDLADQRSLGIDDGDLGLLGGALGDDQLSKRCQGRCLAAQLAADHQHVGHDPGRYRHRLQGLIRRCRTGCSTDRDPRRYPRMRRRPRPARSVRAAGPTSPPCQHRSAPR